MKWVVVTLLVLLAVGSPAVGQSAPTTPSTSTPAAAPDGKVDNPLQVPDLTRVLPAAETRQGVSATLKIFVIMTVLSLAPAILMMTTSFTRILIVLAMLRQALGVAQLPPSQILVGISLFLTFLIMAPTYQRIQNDAIKPWLDNAPGMTQSAALEIATGHLRDFMFNQIERTRNEEDIYLFLEYARKAPIPVSEKIQRKDVGTEVLIPAFILSELKTSFVLGFRVYLPFLVIDMVIATVLISMNMMMLPPALISLPFKLLLFVLADGWHLVVGSLLAGFAA